MLTEKNKGCLPYGTAPINVCLFLFKYLYGFELCYPAAAEECCDDCADKDYRCGDHKPDGRCRKRWKEISLKEYIAKAYKGCYIRIVSHFAKREFSCKSCDTEHISLCFFHVIVPP